MEYAESSAALYRRSRAFTSAQTDAMAVYCEAERELRELHAENAKLRELVRYIMHQCNDGNPRCSECTDWNGGECVALQRMRKLGVEVDA